jgi:threonine/homoserine/homoserine lactone efflux protein
MRLLRFFSRVAFIFNICFLVAAFSQWLPGLPDTAPTWSILALGYFLSIIVNVIVNATVLFLFLIRRLRSAAISPWLLIVNFLFFIAQIILLIINRP